MNIPHYVTSLNLGPNSKVDLILVAMEKIPATAIKFYNTDSKPNRVAHKLREAGLFVLEIKPNSRGAKHISTLCISLTKLNAELLAQLVTFHENQGSSGKKKDSTFHKMFGTLLGYPSTAVEAFARKTNLKLDELPDKFDNHPFFRFMPSKNHWRDELAVMEEWERTIEQVAPHIFKKLQTQTD